MTLHDIIMKSKHLSSISDMKCGLAQRYIVETEEISELIEPMLKVIVSSQIMVDKNLKKLSNELNLYINEIKELLDDWSQTASTIYSVLEIEPLLTKVQASFLQICRQFRPLCQSLESLSAEYVEQCVMRIQPKCYEENSDIINMAIADRVKNGVNGSKHMEKIAESVGLSTNMELLMELAALKMLKSKVMHGEDPREVNYIEHIIDLVNHMHKSYVEKHMVQNTDGVQLPIDIYCPLSLQIMSDPVIVASGQTYERTFIKKWLDQGFTLCPRTWQTIGDANLIPNYTVKALIASWCEMNDIQHNEHPNSDLNLSTEYLVHEDHNANTSNTPNSPPNESDMREIKSNGFTFYSNGFYQDLLDVEPVALIMPTSSSKTKASASTSYGEEGKNKSSSEEREWEDLSGGDNSKVQSPIQLSSDPFQRGEGLTTSCSDAPTVEVAPLRIRQLPPSTQESIPGTTSPTSSQEKCSLFEIENIVKDLIKDLESTSIDVQAAATYELRLMTRTRSENRVIIVDCGALKYLIPLLHSPDLTVQENAVTTLLNLSLNFNNKMAIANAGAIESLVHVLRNGSSEAKGNAAAALYSLSVIDENKPKIGQSEAFRPLVELLSTGTPQARKDAATALFSLSLHHENKLRIVQAGAVRPLVDLMDPSYGIVDKSVAVLANLCSIAEGRDAIGRGGGIPALVEVIELGSTRGRENAAAALLHLCIDSKRGSKYCNMALQADAVPPVKVLAINGSARAKEKAQSLLGYFRNHRQNRARKH